jgi:hypothetical protein
MLPNFRPAALGRGMTQQNFWMTSAATTLL